MNNKSVKNIFLLMLILIFSTNITVLSQNYFFKKYTEADGLVQGTVRQIYQDSKGRMWFGTVDGLSIYDGSEFSNYRAEDGLTVPIISGFLEISDGVMLVGTLGNGIEVLVKQPFQRDSVILTIKDKEFLVDPRVNQIKRDNKGNIWICTEAGFTEWVFDKNSFTNIVHQNDFGELGEFSIYDVSFNSDGKKYFATSKGLLEYDGNHFRFICQSLLTNNEPVFYTYVDRQNTLWFSTLKHLFYLKDGVAKVFKLNGKDLNSGVNAITENKSNEIIICSLGKIILLKNNHVEVIDDKNGYTEKAALSVLIDREENLWTGSLEGVSKLNKSNFRFVNLNSVVLNNPQLIKTDDQILLGNSNGIFKIDKFNLKRSIEFKEFESIRVRDYLKDGDIQWFATENGVIVKKSGKKIIYDEHKGLPHNFVYSVCQDQSGIIWVLTQAGLAYIKNGSLYNFKSKTESGWKYSDLECQSAISTTSIRQAVVDKENTKWITTWRDGLIRIRNDSIYRFTQKDGLNDLRIRCLYLDSKNNLWIGTRFNGVYKYDGKLFYNYSTTNGLNSNWVFSITEDHVGNFWFCTSKGISKFDGERWISFGAADGIYGGEILNTIVKDSMVWFNSWEQIFCYLPESNNEQKIKPTVFFKQVSLLDSNLPVPKIDLVTEKFNLNKLLNLNFGYEAPKIEYTNNTIIFDFAGTTFNGEKQIVYNYKLEGFDKNWIENTKRNYITYAHLPPGNYKFIVYAINRFGLRSEIPATFSFNILAPFWLRWWFIASVILFFILLISSINYLVYQYKIKQALKIEKLRSKISTDLHDEIGTSLSSIAIFAELIKRERKSNDRKYEDKLERIENTSRELVDKMSDIVWMVNPGNDKLNDALLKLKDYALNILESKGIDVVFDIDKIHTNFILPMEVRKSLLLIYKELVTNAAKYSKASLVNIKLKLKNDHSQKIILIVEDNGIGFDLTKTKNGNGIKNIRRRTEDVGGVCKITSEQGSGTRAVIEIPIQ